MTHRYLAETAYRRRIYLLQRYQDGKRAGGTHLFYARDDDRTAVKKLVFYDNVDDEEIRLFVPASRWKKTAHIRPSTVDIRYQYVENTAKIRP